MIYLAEYMLLILPSEGRRGGRGVWITDTDWANQSRDRRDREGQYANDREAMLDDFLVARWRRLLPTTTDGLRLGQNQGTHFDSRRRRFY